MASSLASLQGLHGHGYLLRSNPKQSYITHKRKQTCRAEFNILKIMGGRGLCNGEIGLQKELLKKQLVIDDDIHQSSTEVTASSEKEEIENSENESEKLTASVVAVPEDAFEKEMMGLTGGFPGGEKGLLKFIHDDEEFK